MAEPAWDNEKVRVLFEVLFDVRVLLGELVRLLGGADEEEEEAEEP